MYQIIQRALAGLAIYWLTWIIYCRYFHPLRTVPGPFLASISRSWVVWKTMKGNMEHTQRALHARHGYLVRIAPNEVACSDPEAIKTIYGAKSGFTKTDFYDAWAPPGSVYPGHFPERDEKVHADHRRVVNPIFSMSSVLECESSIDDCTRIFCRSMREFAQQRAVVDIGQWAHMYAFDVLGALFFGAVFGFMSERTDYNNYIASLDVMLPTLTIGGTVPSYLTIFVLPLTLLWSSARGALAAIKHIDKSSKDAVEKRKKEVEACQDAKRDMLRKLLELHAERGDTPSFTWGDVIIESTSSLFAGADTTAIALHSVLYHLMRNDHASARLHAEIDAAIGEDKLSNPVKYSEAIKLPYLNAVIKEAMRIHPSVGLTMPRNVPDGGATISGFYFPAGYRIGVNPAVVHFDKGVFGNDAVVFNPDRWLDSEAATGMEKATLTFGGGSRTCIGKNISLSEIYKLVPQIYREFTLSLVDPNKEWKTRNFWFNKQIDVEILVKERKAQLKG